MELAYSILGSVAIVASLTSYGDRQSVSKCATAYYSTDPISREETFSKCMKSEFPTTFLDASKQFAKLDEDPN